MKGSGVYTRSPRPQHAGLQDAREAPTTLTPGCPHHAGLWDARDAPTMLTPGCPHHAGLRDAPATLASGTPGTPPPLWPLGRPGRQVTRSMTRGLPLLPPSSLPSIPS